MYAHIYFVDTLFTFIFIVGYSGVFFALHVYFNLIYLILILIFKVSQDSQAMGTCFFLPINNNKLLNNNKLDTLCLDKTSWER